MRNPPELWPSPSVHTLTPQSSRGRWGSSRARPHVLLLASPGPPEPQGFFYGGVFLPRMLWHKKPEICTTDPVRHCTPRRERAKANFDRGAAEPGPPARRPPRSKYACLQISLSTHACKVPEVRMLSNTLKVRVLANPPKYACLQSPPKYVC